MACGRNNTAYASVYCLIRGAKMVPNFTKPAYTEIWEDTSRNGETIENTGFFLTTTNTCKKLYDDFRL